MGEISGCRGAGNQKLGEFIQTWAGTKPQTPRTPYYKYKRNGPRPIENHQQIFFLEGTLSLEYQKPPQNRPFSA